MNMLPKSVREFHLQKLEIKIPDPTFDTLFQKALINSQKENKIQKLFHSFDRHRGCKQVTEIGSNSD